MYLDLFAVPTVKKIITFEITPIPGKIIIQKINSNFGNLRVDD